MENQQQQSNGTVANIGAATRSPEDILRMFMGQILNICSAIAWPVEMILRPKYGTRYVHPVIQIIGWAIQVLAFVGGFMLSQTHSFHALIGMGTFYALFWLGGAYHSIRCWRLMLNLDREVDSQDEGPAWFFFYRVPWGEYWGPVRIIYEPAFMAISAALLTLLHLFHPIVGLWVLVMAMALSVKNTLRWYEAWLYGRTARDIDSRAKVIERIVEGRKAPQTIGGLPVITPPHTSQIEKARIVAHNLGLDAETAAMLSPRSATGD